MSNSDDDKNLNPEDKALWDDFTRDIRNEAVEEDSESFEELLDGKTKPLVNEIAPVNSIGTPSESFKTEKIHKKSSQPPQLDKRTEEKLRKGKMPIEARIDLHGMTRDLAHEALERFIIESYKRGLRNVLVITGKGKSKATSEDWLIVGEGVLKTNVPFWLDGTNLKSYILKYINAQPKDGGTGALYVYLKRKR